MKRNLGPNIKITQDTINSFYTDLDTSAYYWNKPRFDLTYLSSHYFTKISIGLPKFNKFDVFIDDDDDYRGRKLSFKSH